MKRLTIPRAWRPLKARVSAVGPDFASAWRCGTDLSGRRPGGEHARDGCAVGDPAGGDEWQLSAHARFRESQQGEQTQRLADRWIREAAAVPAGLEPLEDQGVRARGGRLLGLVGARDRNPDVRSSGLDPLDDGGLGEAERERHNRRR
jgi:hypothetical protein